jgi:hypothetical protein
VIIARCVFYAWQFTTDDSIYKSGSETKLLHVAAGASNGAARDIGGLGYRINCAGIISNDSCLFPQKLLCQWRPVVYVVKRSYFIAPLDVPIHDLAVKFYLFNR